MAIRWLLLLGLVIAPVAAHAQTVHGVVIDADSAEPIAGVQLELIDDVGRRVATAETDRAGTFLLPLRGTARFTLRLTHLGYTTVESDTVEVRPRESLSVQLRMAREAIPLEPLIVTARADARGISGMHERMNRPGAEGVFLTREDIDRRPSPRATDLLRGIPGVDLAPVGMGGTVGSYITMRGLGVSTGRLAEGEPTHGATDRCEPTVYVDGTMMHQGETLDTFLSTSSLEGVEVYTRGNTAPPPLLALNDCGVVAFWTRTGALDGFSWRRLAVWLGAMGLVFTLASR